MSPKKRIVFLVVPVIAIAVVWYLTRGIGGTDRLTASGTVEATDADLGFQIPGRIATVFVRLGDRVQLGDTLAMLDDSELRARADAARAQVAAARARLAELQSGFRIEEIAQARAAVRVTERRLEDAHADVQRSTVLYEGGAISREMLDKHETVQAVAAAEHERTTEQLRLVETGARSEQVAAARAAVRQAEANVTVVEANLAQSKIIAPFAGRVTLRQREPGEVVGPGAPVVSITNSEDRWVRIYVREDAIGRVALGRAVQITADTYPERTYGGEIVYISDEAEFTPSNVQTTEERVKLVYEVRVRITQDQTLDLKPGIAADVVLEPTAT